MMQMNNWASKILPVLLFLAFLAGLTACSDSSSAGEDNTSEIINTSVQLSDSGMIAVAATGKSVLLGSADSNANLRELPQMQVRFTYDFYLGKHEVTKGELSKVLKVDESKDGAETSANEPAVNVTFGDAVLYANAVSKQGGFDTVYTYTAVTYDAEKHVLFLENYSFHPEISGYRLPTEAEWIYGASRGWNPDSSWNSENSDYRVHNVCTAGTNELGLCDMAGNAAEWINDWMGSFADTALTDYIGAIDGGSQGERILKGGSYRNSPESMTLSSRTDVYTVSSSMKAAYVGFRLAFGAIPNATQTNYNGSISVSPVKILSATSLVQAMTGDYYAKLVFRNDITGNLNFIEFRNSTPVVVEIADTIDVFHPDISPDGSKVAFCTKMEGVSGKSSLYVRNLDSLGSHLVKLDVESAAIPRWRVSEGGDTSIVYVTDAGSNETEETWKGASTWEVPFSNGKFGKPKKLFDGTFHGGISPDNHLAVTGSKKLRSRRGEKEDVFSSKAKEEVWYNGEQACNVSLAQDSTKKTLFLDFGSKTGADFAGESYGTHERILVADSTGKLINALKPPEGYSFDHSEWTIHNSNSIVATLVNVNGVHKKIALVDIPTELVLEVVEGDELWHPCVWVRKSAGLIPEGNLNLDSAGMYLVPGSEWYQEAVRVKMELFWTALEKIEVLGVGSSRMEDGFVPNEISYGYALNMAHSSNDLDGAIRIAENYGLNHASNLKVIVLDIGIDLWHDSTAYSDNLFNGAPGYIYDANHNYWKDSLPESFVTAVKESYPATSLAQTTYTPSRGYLKNDIAYGWGKPVVEGDSNWTQTYPEMISWHERRLASFLEAANEKNVKVVGAIFPINPDYRKTGAWGRYGVRRSDSEGIFDILYRLEKENPNFILFDENKNGNHDYGDDMALNTDHLVYKGAAQFTARLDSLLKSLDEK